LIQKVDTVAAHLACLMLFSLMLLVVSDVALRYVFNSPFFWSYDVISLFLLPGVFFLSVGNTHANHGHVAVDILQNYLGERTRYVFESITSLTAGAVFIFISIVAANKTWIDFLSGTYFSSGLEVPTWSTSFMLPVGFGLLALRCILNGVAFLVSIFADDTWIALPPISGENGVKS
jgi:TRAP-type C4-dicarboxylate transport system permease small subunit